MRLFRWAVRVVVYGAVTAGLWNVGCRLVDATSAGLSGLVADFVLAEEAYRKDLEQTAVLEALQLRVQTRLKTVREVMEGRLSLREAAARTREQHRQWPPVNMGLLRDCYPGCSDDEVYCRLLIRGVETELELDGDDGRGKAILARLEAEMEEILRYPDLARLPDPT
jgi:hypothetical protein